LYHTNESGCKLVYSTIESTLFLGELRTCSDNAKRHLSYVMIITNEA
jgi:hypothetical protein